MADEKKPDGGTPTPDDKGKGSPELEAVRAELATTNKRLEEVTQESIARRQELKELKPLKGLFDGLRQTLGVEGDASALEAKVKEVTTASQSKLRSILLRSEVTAAAARAGMRDPSDAFRMVDLADVQVDVEKESVDQKVLGDRLAQLKTAKPYLFADGKPAGDENHEEKPPASTQDPGSPDLGGKGSALATWRALVKAGKKLEAAHFYNAHKKEIEPAPKTRL